MHRLDLAEALADMPQDDLSHGRCPHRGALSIARPLGTSKSTRLSDRKASPTVSPSRTGEARRQARLDLALLDVDGDDLRRAEILGAEDAAAERRVIGQRHVLGPHAEHQRSARAILMDLGDGDIGVGKSDRAIAALQRCPRSAGNSSAASR